MTITISDPVLIAAFRASTGDVKVTDDKGEVICAFTAQSYFKLPPGVTCPFTDEALEERMKGEDSELTGSEFLCLLQDRG